MNLTSYNARANTVEEIIRARHPDSPCLDFAVLQARNAVFAGASAHRALELAEDWVTTWDDLKVGEVR
jgi:hypothetical protein